MVCNLSPLSLCLSVIPNIYYYYAKYPDLMNIPKTKPNTRKTPETYIMKVTVAKNFTKIHHLFFRPWSCRKVLVLPKRFIEIP